ncbi:MAG TPA: aldose 1-epimerase family protein [Phnomibacter sp.]|nr:aldose 1-epimerase family protein [Phnomibacter sp.]
MIHLKNHLLEVGVCRKGAELRSLMSTATGIEYMWQADPAFWAKHSPVLFPIVGSLKNDAFLFDGKAYTLPRHGFARDRVFSAEQVSATRVVFTLEADDESLRVYPFQFRLQLIYELNDNRLHCTYVVANRGDAAMLFSIGGHPAFNVPLVAGTAYDDHYISFPQDDVLERSRLQDGLISEQMEKIGLSSGRLPLQASLFYDDAIVLRSLKSRKVTLGAVSHAHGLDFFFEGFPYLGIWAAKDAPFVCIEPWCGHADTVGHDQDLAHKPGIIDLPSGEHWQRTWVVECF